MKMVGVFLIVVGCFSFILGIFLVTQEGKASEPGNSEKVSKRIKDLPEAGKKAVAITKEYTTYSINSQPRPSTTHEENLTEFIDIAIADGVLTSNEKAIIRKISSKKGLNYNKIIAEAEVRIQDQGIKSETELIDYNKKNGLDFEKYIVKKFNREYFQIIEWTGDKFIDGRFSEKNYQPDLLMQLTLKDRKERFSVECKWRSSFYSEISIASEDQFNRYKKYEEDTGIPVFIALGIGKTGSDPKNLYILRLKELKSNLLKYEDIRKYRKNTDSDFFFDAKTEELR